MVHCAVPGCTSHKSKGKEVGTSFHKFPLDKLSRKKWIISIRRDPGKNFQITKSTTVCSKHFKPEDYENRFDVTRKRYLIRGAVPSIFSFNKKETASLKKTRRKLTYKNEEREVCHPGAGTSSRFDEDDERNREINLLQLDEPTTGLSSTSDSATDTASEVGKSDDSLAEISAEESATKSAVKKSRLKLLKEVHTKRFCLSRFSSSDSKMRYYTGLKSYHIFYALYQFLYPACTQLNYIHQKGTLKSPVKSSIVTRSHSKQKTFEETSSKPGRSRALNPMEELFITLVRLRKALPEQVLADLYDVSQPTISRIINTWIIFLADRFKYLPIWPSRSHVQETMPPCFTHNFPHTRVIVDCTEMFIEKPSASHGQRETFSTYKHHNTTKALIGIAPTGQVTFISNLYTGRVSDKKLTKHCGILDKLEDGDEVMADKGFDISDLLESRGFKLVIPPFLTGKSQFSEDELTQTRNIAAVRVHVERAIKKIKEFKILSSIIPVTLLPMAENIWQVCSHLSNFTGSGKIL